MNYLSIFAFILAGLVFGVAVVTATDNPQSMLDFHGFLIVIGGSIAATAISFQIDRIIMMLKVFWNRTLRGKKPDYVQIIKDLMLLAESYRNDDENLDQLISQQKDDFMRESMMILTDEVVTGNQMIRVFRTRVNTLFQRYADDANTFKSMGKYPPAMGLMGAVLGMIALLGGLGKPGAEGSIGPAMSVALVATLYGIAMANLIIIPIGENLNQCAKELKTKNQIIVEGVRLISEKTNPIVLAEELNSFLLPGERIDWKKLKYDHAN